MSATSIIGALGVARQSAKGTANTTYAYIPATSLGINAQQQVSAYPLEIGGEYLSHGSYKTGVAVSGDAGILLRPSSIGHVLYGLCGSITSTPVPSQSGAFSHVITPFAPAAGVSLPWYTIEKNVSYIWAEQYTDCKFDSLSIDISKQSIVSTQVGVFGITPTEVAVPSSPVFDSSTVFQTCQATVTLTDETGDTTISANSNYAERVSLSFQNQLSQDEYYVGGYSPADVTLQSRSCSISYDLVIRDPALRRAVYQNGGTSAWSPTVYRGHLHLTLASSQNIAATTQPYQLDIDFPGIDFMMMPLTMTSSELIRATLSANVTLGPSGSDKWTFTLISNQSGY